MTSKKVKVLRGKKSETHLRKVIKSWRSETVYMLIEIGFKPKEIDEMFDMLMDADGNNEDPKTPNLDALDDLVSRIEPGTRFYKILKEEMVK